MMYILATAYLCATVIVSQSIASCNLPFSKRCKANDPHLAQCWNSVLKDVPQYLWGGVPKMNVPLDPWRSKGKYTTYGPTFTFAHQDMEHAGVNNFEITENTIDLSSNIITLKLRFPKLDHTCTVLADGTLFGFKLLGQYGCNDANVDVTFLFVFRGRRITRNEKEYIDFNNIDITVDGNYSNQAFHNFVPGGPVANENFSIAARKANAVFSKIYDECIRVSLGNDIAAVIKNVYSECPLDNLHPF